MRPGLLGIVPYQPVEPTEVLSKRAGIETKNIIKLDANENPYGCSVKVKKALANFPYYSLYPDPEQRDLRIALQKYTGFKKDNILAGSGSDELIELLLRLFLEPGDKVLNCPPTFSMYKFCTQMCLGKLVDIPRKADFSIDIPSTIRAIDEKTKIMFIASPNNPSGNMIKEEEVVKLLKNKIVVVIDEAYIEFSGHSMADMVTEYSNLIILRTLSKWAGLAGLRVGYGIMPTFILNQLMKIKQPYNVNAAAQIAAIESLKDLGYLNNTIARIRSERERLYKKLEKIVWLKTYPSESNFILCRVLEGDAKQIHQKLQKKGIFIRYYNSPDLSNFVRITVGKPSQTNKLISALSEVR